jgi:hypothetical protein
MSTENFIQLLHGIYTSQQPMESTQLWATSWNGADSISQNSSPDPTTLRQWQSYCLNTNTWTGCWRHNTRTTETEIYCSWTWKNFFFLSKSLSCSLFFSAPSLSVHFFGSLFFFLFLSSCLSCSLFVSSPSLICSFLLFSIFVLFFLFLFSLSFLVSLVLPL